MASSRIPLLIAAGAGASLAVWWIIKNRKAKKKPQQIAFAITGFGRFRGVDDNPTEVLVKIFPSWLKKHPLPPNVVVDRCQILEVSGVGAKEGLEDMRGSCFEQTGQMRVWVHLGVDARSKAFKLERAAWNEATFRVPDERGWEPQNECVVAEDKKGGGLWSGIRVPRICSRLARRGFEVAVSKDPGRFVCNWLYYCSLHECEARNSTAPPDFPMDRPEDALFVHVPPFEVFDSERQLSFVHAVLQEVAAQLL